MSDTPRRVYVAASWRTPRQPEVVAVLRTAGFSVYDFRHPEPSFAGHAWADRGFNWREIDPEWQSWTPEAFVAGLQHPVAVAGFETDMAALRAADVCVLVQPSGRSAALECGWACGAGKPVAVLLAPGQEPELMLRMAALLTSSLDEIVAWARGVRLVSAGEREPLLPTEPRAHRLTPEYLADTLRELAVDNDAAATDVELHIAALEAELADARAGERDERALREAMAVLADSSDAVLAQLSRMIAGGDFKTVGGRAQATEIIGQHGTVIDQARAALAARPSGESVNGKAGRHDAATPE